MTERDKLIEDACAAISAVEMFAFNILENAKARHRAGAAFEITANDLSFAILEEVGRNPGAIKTVFIAAADTVEALRKNDEEVGK